MKKEYFCDIYVAQIPSGEVDFEHLYPEIREKEVFGVKNERVKREKYFVWRLFERALRESLGSKIKDLKIEKNANGKWMADGIYFSLSHAKDAVAVAISNSAVGIDIEPLSALKNDISKRILTKNELSEYETLLDGDKSEYIIKKWTGKEAIFKSRDEVSFRPENIEVFEHNVRWFNFDMCNESYLCAVSGESVDDLVIFDISEI